MPRLTLGDKQKIVARKTRKMRAQAAMGKEVSPKSKRNLAKRASMMMATAVRKTRSS